MMDTKTGTIEQKLKVAPTGLLALRGTPYFLLPDENRGVFNFGQDLTKMAWADLTVSDSKLEYTKKETAANLWSSSMPQQYCPDGTIVTFGNVDPMGGADTLYNIVPKDASIPLAIDLTTMKGGPGTSGFGGVACTAGAEQVVVL